MHSEKELAIPVIKGMQVMKFSKILLVCLQWNPSNSQPGCWLTHADLCDVIYKMAEGMLESNF